jgi:hypothetical protein
MQTHQLPGYHSRSPSVASFDDKETSRPGGTGMNEIMEEKDSGSVDL